MDSRTHTEDLVAAIVLSNEISQELLIHTSSIGNLQEVAVSGTICLQWDCDLQQCPRRYSRSRELGAV